MTDPTQSDSTSMKPSTPLNLNLDAIRLEAHNRQGDCIALLSLLRDLESLHQEIRDTLFQEALPRERQALYNLLKDIEAEGGWPYIYRPKLQILIKKLLAQLEDAAESEAPSTNEVNSTPPRQ